MSKTTLLDLIKPWEAELEEQLKYKTQLETALNHTNAKIRHLQGGIQFAKESIDTEKVEVASEKE